MYLVLKSLYGDVQSHVIRSRSSLWIPDGLESKVFIGLLIAINFVVMLYTIRCIGSIPLLDLVSGNATMERRIEISRSFPGNEIVKNLFGVTLSLILCFYGVLNVLLNPQRKTILVCAITLIPAIFFSTYSYEKSPILFLLLGIVMAWIAAKGGVSKIFFAAFVFLIMSTVIVLYLLLGVDSEDLASSGITAGPLGRVLFTQIAGMYLSFTYFPQIHDYVGFASIGGSFSGLFGIEDSSDRVARIIMAIFNPEGVSDGVAGVVNSYYLAEAWGNFGIAGVIIAPLVVGLWFVLINLFEFGAEKTIFSRAIVIFFTLKLPLGGGINDFLFSIGLIYVLFLAFLASLVAGFWRIGPFRQRK